LPPDWSGDVSDPATRARRIGDYIAGMTDRYALTEHARWIGGTPDLR
jgi:dGTPase